MGDNSWPWDLFGWLENVRHLDEFFLRVEFFYGFDVTTPPPPRVTLEVSELPAQLSPGLTHINLRDNV